MLVNPATPLVEVVRATLVRNALKGTDSYTIVKRDDDRPFFYCLRMSVLEDYVIAAGPVVMLPELLKNIDNFSP